MTGPQKPAQAEKSDSVATKGSEKATELWHSLVHWAELPHWQQDNQHIHGSYRKASYSYSKSFRSVLHWHNESVNIWSHLVPATLSLPFGIFLYKILQPRYEKASIADVFAMSCFFFGAAFCLGMSATYHAVSNHSPSVAKFWNQLDYAGIAILIAGSFVPSVYYGFWCNSGRQLVYWTMVSQSFSLAMLFAEILCRFQFLDLHALLYLYCLNSEHLHGDPIGHLCLSEWVSRRYFLSLMD